MKDPTFYVVYKDNLEVTYIAKTTESQFDQAKDSGHYEGIYIYSRDDKNIVGMEREWIDRQFDDEIVECYHTLGELLSKYIFDLM